MKKQIAALITAGMITFGGVAMAGTGGVKGTLSKIEGEYYIVKTDDGKEVKAHFNDKTQKVGAIKEGAMVEVYVDDKGHATKIEEHKH
jgi:hypothetical protein